jgi:prefoldin alpha subunit
LKLNDAEDANANPPTSRPKLISHYRPPTPVQTYTVLRITMATVESLPPGAVDILTLSAPELSGLQSRLSQELEHLTTSYTRQTEGMFSLPPLLFIPPLGTFSFCQPPPPIPSVFLLSPQDLLPPKSFPVRSTLPPFPTNRFTSVGAEILVPLTQSLYVPGTLASSSTVLVDVGTGFYVEKSAADAIKFYNGKVDDLSKKLGDLERVVQGKNENLRIVEEGS